MKAKSTKRAITIAILMLVQLAVSSTAPFFSSRYDGYLKVTFVKLIYALSFIVPCFLWKRVFKPIGATYSKHLWCEYKKPLFFIAFAAIVAFLQINTVFLELFPSLKSVSGSFMPQSFLGFVFSILMYAVIPAFTEEMFFRGVIMRVSGAGVRAAILSGVLFGLCHFNPAQLIYAVGSGIVLGLLFLYSNDIKLSVLLHFCVNFVVVLLSYMAKLLPVGAYVAGECIVWLAVLAVGIYYSYVLLRDYQIQLNSKTDDIKKNKGDIGCREIFSSALIIVYALIILATVLRYL